MSDLINSTVGIFEKLVPVIFIDVATAFIIVCETFATVGSVGVGTSAKAKTPEPFVFKNWSVEPSAFGKLNPSKINLPVALGVNFKSILVSPPVAEISGPLLVVILILI